MLLNIGWVCYAEKTHGNFILPYISVTKSPQQIMGSLVKYHLAKIMDLSPKQIYHITVMPCYDKKLEASREDFYNHEIKCRDVDCVITPSKYYPFQNLKKIFIYIYFFFNFLN